MKRRRATSEQAIQRAIFQHLRARGAPGVFAFHPANGGYRKRVEAAIMKGLGVVAGVPDVIAIRDGRVFALEVKAEGGRATDAQLACIAALREAGAFTCIAEGLDRALACLESWGLLRGHVVTHGQVFQELRRSVAARTRRPPSVATTSNAVMKGENNHVAYL
jgi:hypothetical protein